MAETLTFDNTPETEVLNADEQDSLEVGEKMMAEQEGLLAGKYKDASQLEQAYLELQKKLGEGSDDDEEEEGEEYEEDDSEEYEFEHTEATQAISNASSEFYETGEISEETFEALSQMSSAELLGAYMSMQEAAGDGGSESFAAEDLGQSEVQAIKDSVGGDEAYSAITEWAGQNLSDESVDAFEAIIDNGSPEMIQLAVDGLKAKYDNAFGVEGELLQGKPPTSSGSTFRSQAEVVQAISDPRYETDEAYRNDVLMKLDRSDISF